mgnify:FL=1
MDKDEYLKKLDRLQLDKARYCILSGGAMVMHGLKERTADIDIKVRPDYFEELKTKFSFKKSPKYDYLWELGEGVEVAVQDYDEKDVEMVDGYPVIRLELELEWKLRHNRPKDRESIRILKAYLGK